MGFFAKIHFFDDTDKQKPHFFDDTIVEILHFFDDTTEETIHFFDDNAVRIIQLSCTCSSFVCSSFACSSRGKNPQKLLLATPNKQSFLCLLPYDAQRLYGL